MTLEQEAFIRRIAGRVRRMSSIQSAARHQALVTAGRLVIEDAMQAYDPRHEESWQAYLKQRIHFAMFDAMRKFDGQERSRKAA